MNTVHFMRNYYVDHQHFKYMERESPSVPIYMKTAYMLDLDVKKHVHYTTLMREICCTLPTYHMNPRGYIWKRYYIYLFSK